MFKIYRHGKVLPTRNGDVGRNAFSSYEKARQGLRKFLRRAFPPGSPGRKEFAWWDSISRNPTNMTDFGFTIKRVA